MMIRKDEWVIGSYEEEERRAREIIAPGASEAPHPGAHAAPYGDDDRDPWDYDSDYRDRDLDEEEDDLDEDDEDDD